MAKKKKVEDEYSFVPPQFDERAFIEKDLADSKIVIITTVFGILVGAAAAAATIYVSSILGFLIIIAMVYGLFKLLFRALKVNLSSYKRKDYIYKGGTYLVTAVAIWILLLNPPFAFATPPSFHGTDAITMHRQSGSTWVSVPLNITSAPTIAAGQVNITAHVLSIGSAKATLYITFNSSTTSVYTMSYVSNFNYQYIMTVSAGYYQFYVVAKSGSGTQAKSGVYGFTVT